MYNGHGDVMQTVSPAGGIENQYDYDIFGNQTLANEQYPCTIRYTGEFYDAQSGLYYLRARYYDPYVGRFISEDSYTGKDSDPLSLNLYTYCTNNPIDFFDPTGHMNYWTQSHLLLGGYIEKANEVRRNITGEFNVGDIIKQAKQGIKFWENVGNIGKSLFEGDMGWDDIAGILGNMATEALIGDLMYLKDNYKQFSTDTDISNNQAWELGRRTAGAITEVASIGFSLYGLSNAVKNFFGKGTISVGNIKLNPKDDVFKRGFNDESVTYQRNYILTNGDISREEPFVVYELTDGSYMMQNGHHRLEALKQLGIKNVKPDQIIKLTPEKQKEMLGE